MRNAIERSHEITFDGMVDTGASHLVLQFEWRERLGTMGSEQHVALSLANKGVIEGLMCGPVEVQNEGFRPMCSPRRCLLRCSRASVASTRALVGYLVLEMIPVAVDMIGHRLGHAGALDPK